VWVAGAAAHARRLCTRGTAGHARGAGRRWDVEKPCNFI
jgi:hypothetical protein